MKNSRIALLALALSTPALAQQDVNMQSNTSEWLIMNVENTGTAAKTGVQINTAAAAGSTGLAIHTTSTGIYTAIYDNAETYIVSGASQYISDYDAWNPRGYMGSVSGGDNAYVQGVKADASGGNGATVYGIYGTAYTGTGGFAAAGYFDGDVWGATPYQVSDQKFKTNVRDLSGGLDKVMALKPRLYDMRTEEFKGKMNVGSGEHIGFIAQELETVLPQLVKEGVAPPKLTREEEKNKVKKEGIRFKGVEYTGVIPVLVKAVQEQQAMIQAMQAEIAALKAR